MSKYTATISWRHDPAENFLKGTYSRGHEWTFDGGITVPASSSPHSVRLPFSREDAVDPEEALVAAASSCHMLTFLYIASRKGFTVASYTDEAVGELTKGDDGRESISKITLDPRIDWTGGAPDAEQLAELHHSAHENCYIANSIRADIVIKEAA